MSSKKQKQEMGGNALQRMTGWVGGKSMPGNSGSSEPVRSIIGQDLTFTGNVTSTGAIELLGKIEGDVQCSSILIGEKGQILGTMIAEDVVVRGRFIGLIRALRVTLHGPAHVEGEIHCQSMAVEHGVYFEGKTRRLEAPLAAGESPSDSPASAADTARLEFQKQHIGD